MGSSQWTPSMVSRTYVEGLEDPDEIPLPTYNSGLIFLRVDESRG